MNLRLLVICVVLCSYGCAPKQKLNGKYVNIWTHVRETLIFKKDSSYTHQVYSRFLSVDNSSSGKYFIKNDSIYFISDSTKSLRANHFKYVSKNKMVVAKHKYLKVNIHSKLGFDKGYNCQSGLDFME